MLAGIPASSPNLSASNPSLSPVGSSGEDGRPVSPPAPPHRLSFPPTSASDSPRIPTSAAALDPSQFLSSAEAAAAAAANSPLSGLASAYPRLPPAMMALSAVPGLTAPYTATSVGGGDNPYPSLSVENFYNPLVRFFTKLIRFNKLRIVLTGLKTFILLQKVDTKT